MQPGKDQAVHDPEGLPLGQMPALYVNLMPKDQDLGYQRSSRPEQLDQRRPNKAARFPHKREALRDSASAVSPIRFTTGTAVLFLFNVIETKFLRASSTSEFSHRLGQKPILADVRGKSALPSIVLKKFFLTHERYFLGPLMPFAGGDVRDHIVSPKNDHGPSYRLYRALQRWGRLKIDFREIFGVVRFSTFATVSP
jgi:hypothetical protein